jgi:hypothetical protein
MAFYEQKRLTRRNRIDVCFAVSQVDLLKSVLNREGYLSRLQQCVKTVNRKFKSQVAELLDLVRAASLDVIECIIAWREAKVRL